MKNDVKRSLLQIDSDVLNNMLEVAQMALNDAGTSQRVANELDVPVERVYALISLLIELSDSDGNRPKIVTPADLQAEEGKIARMINDPGDADISFFYAHQSNTK